ncbi:MAG: sigma-70 family RNA polymerase sigma factor [Mycobacterium sp.]
MLESIEGNRLPARPAKSRSYRGEDLPGVRFTRDAMRYRDELLRHAWHLTKSRVDAEDLLQDTMLKAYQSHGKFDAGSNLRAWLYRIMVNTWVDGYRSARRRPTEQLSAEISDAQMADYALHVAAAPATPEAEALKSVPGGAIRALRTLPRDLRTTIYYADIEGYRNTEIAEMLHIPEGTVASRLHRGRRQLRALLLVDTGKERGEQ